MATNYYRIQWQQTTEKIRGLFVMIMIVQLFFGFVSVQSVFREYVSYSIYNGVATIMVTLVTLRFPFQLGCSRLAVESIFKFTT